MLVDNLVVPNMSGYTLGSTIEDFFNFEMLAGPSAGPGSSSSRSSSNSPSNSFAALPITPPNAFEISSSEFFNFGYEDDFKVDPLAMPPTATAPYDFLGAFNSPSEGGSPASDSSPSSGSEHSPSTINPQVVNTPSLSTAMSDFDEEEEQEQEELDEQDQDDDDGLSVAPVKVGGKGKGRKGTVQSGGVVKKTGAKEKKENKPTGFLTTTSSEPDDWRPSPEEYKKMSSKEKRQLRNKISARNFRVRRKEYITTLEGDIAERDRLIDAIRSELGSTKSENSALRHEVSALKKALIEGRGRPDTPVLPPPGPLPVVPAAITAFQSPPPTPKVPLVTPNIYKDLPTSPHLNGRNFWGGNLSGFGGITPVHTTLVPDLSSVLSGKPNLGRRSPALQENINPMLNGIHNHQDKPKDSSIPITPFDSFTDLNPFTLKTIDAYRMQLWGRMAQQQAAHHHQQQQQQPQQGQQPLTGLATGLRPHYFAKSPTLSAILAGKPSSSAYPSPPPSPPTLHSSTAHNQLAQTPTPQQAMLASMASQTLLGKLGSAFWDAFSGSSPSSGVAGRSRDWDTDKVRRVLEGKAVLRVVDVEPSPAPVPSPVPSTSNERAGPSRLSRMPSTTFPDKSSKSCGPAGCLAEMLGSLHI
ncbi:hypothetical protein EW026_g3373 [Hermanssonia centrifuga]|uniref:BZIP domain-containing protein n=1 Tax=Hermanssonia centrifuga TaxID=98765 RepID=A0A4S4KKC8_9APHY|nr:hypothetical protein EW026_g3373 [Hermanssonia centrifuga]